MSSENAHTWNPDRTYNVKNNIDAQGKEWKIYKMRQQGLYYARPTPDRQDAVLPKILSGRFTKSELCQRSINTYLNQSWDASELAQVKATRAKEAAEEQERLTAEALKNAEVVVKPSVPQEIIVEVPEVTAAEMLAEAEADAPAQTPEEKIQAAVDAENAELTSAKAAEKKPSKSQAKRKAMQKKAATKGS